MKHYLALLLLVGGAVHPIAVADTTENTTVELNEYATLNSNLDQITKHLNKLTALFKNRPNKVPAIVKQVKKAEKYLQSTSAQKVQQLLTEGFPCPPKEQITPDQAKKINKALKAMETFRKTYALWLQHANEDFDNCEIAKDAYYMEEALRPISEIAMFDYIILYESLHETDRSIPELDDYKK